MLGPFGTCAIIRTTPCGKFHHKSCWSGRFSSRLQLVPIIIQDLERSSSTSCVGNINLTERLSVVGRGWLYWSVEANVLLVGEFMCLLEFCGPFPATMFKEGNFI